MYDENGQLLTTSFLDYQIPQAEDIPDIHSFRTETTTFANLARDKRNRRGRNDSGNSHDCKRGKRRIGTPGYKVEKMPLSMNYVKQLIGDN